MAARDVGLPDDVLRNIHSYLEFYPGLPASIAVCREILDSFGARRTIPLAMAFVERPFTTELNLRITPARIEVVQERRHGKYSCGARTLYMEREFFTAKKIIRLIDDVMRFLAYVTDDGIWQELPVTAPCAGCEESPLASSGLCVDCTIRSILLPLKHKWGAKGSPYDSSD